MNNEIDNELETQFFRLLQEADPKTFEHPDLAEEFARRLADFAEDWAADNNVDEEEKQLHRWIESKTSKH